MAPEDMQEAQTSNLIESSIITVLDEFEQLYSDCPRDAETISFELVIAGKTVPFHINVADKQATLADIVPPARRLSEKLTNLFLDRLRKNGQPAPCRKGCAACCSYLIPLSIPEVFCLREELLSMPADDSREILRACLDTAEKILNSRSQKSYLESVSENGQFQTNQMSKWYAGLKLACPFLSDGLCMLYEQRPLACREHLVTGSSFFCQPDHGGEPTVAAMPISVLEAVGRLTAELEGLDIEAVMLPLAFPWAQNNLPRMEHTWPAVTMVKRFVEILEEMAVGNAETSAVLT
jgi:Fe-S-cluster containining protein